MVLSRRAKRDDVSSANSVVLSMERKTMKVGWSALAVGLGVMCMAGSVSAKTVKSSASDRKDVSITVYNQNFGLVREVRDLKLGTGRVELEFGDVASRIQPQTVHIKALGGGGLSVLEQNYRYDLLAPRKLLEKFVGKKINVYRYNQRTGKETKHPAKLLSVASVNRCSK